ncbi:low-density lipoprotein receptor class A domain-containing protein 3-like [Palaemon carinicauda]|uniref:low-density lipoprotein receptor class A domain-containing protein 3-like n=1 Tax=Palaemon carinicauda TaxID=392227 RepID=UPI0035B59EC7
MFKPSAVLAILCIWLTGTLCFPKECMEGYFMCDTGLCIPDGFVCDGVYDCTSGYDELDCDKKNLFEECFQGYYQCANGLCIPEMFVCDGVYDCITGSDEVNCTINHQ